MRLDCDGDTVLVIVDQVGAACHTGTHSCFDADVLLAADAPSARSRMEELFSTDAYLRSFEAAVAEVDRERAGWRWPAPRSTRAAAGSRTISAR